MTSLMTQWNWDASQMRIDASLMKGR
jgi:hypothetical protein